MSFRSAFRLSLFATLFAIFGLSAHMASAATLRVDNDKQQCPGAGYTSIQAAVDAAVALDIHTGLGPTGRLTVFQTADEDEPAAALGADWYPEHLYRADRSEADPIDHGLMGPGLDAWAADRRESMRTAAFVLEFGGLDIAHGVTAFRADNWLAHHGDRNSDTGQQIRQLMEDHFFVRDGDWRQQVADQGEMAIHAALDGLT